MTVSDRVSHTAFRKLPESRNLGFLWRVFVGMWLPGIMRDTGLYTVKLNGVCCFCGIKSETLKIQGRLAMRKLEWKDLDLQVRVPKKIGGTEELAELKEFVGQKRAMEALKTGLSIGSKGYNIFVSGLTNTGRRTFVRSFLEKEAKGRPSPNDWVYVYNFQDPRQPNVITVEAGLGKTFKKEMSSAVELIVSAVSEAFQSDEYQKKLSGLQNEQNSTKKKILEELVEKSKEKDYTVQINQTGVATIPNWNGKPLSREVYDELSDEEKEKINKRGEEVRELVNEYVFQMRKIDKEYIEKMKELNKYVASFAIEGHLEELRKKFEQSKDILDFLDRMKTDILDNLNYFFSKEHDEAAIFKRRYSVNLFVDNSETEGRPVVEEMNSTYSNLFGRIEYIAKMGTLDTDHTMIRAGSLVKANGGFLILDARTVLSEPYVWFTLKQVLFSGSLAIENFEHRAGFLSTVSLKPAPIPIDVKIILIGEPWIYSLLSSLEPDFKKLFKIKAEFDWETRKNPESVDSLCRYVCTAVQEDSLLHFDRSALRTVIQKAVKLSGHRGKLSTRFGRLRDLLIESSTIATGEEKQRVSSRHVKEAWEAMKRRVSLYRDKVEEMFEEASIIVDTEGEKTGEVNALTVITLEDISFGVPVKLTAKVVPGNKGITDIHREAELSGKIHNKASLVIQGFLNSRYAKDFPISVTAFVNFEQVYNIIEGDSASLAEIAALLSSISGVPIKQGIAVTGSANQSGIVQPVGGVPEKIEGFFRLCQMKGLTGDQGVIIPASNYRNLVLEDEVVNAVKRDRFYIWTVEHVDEALELMMGIEPGNLDDKQEFPSGSLNRMVQDRLRELHKLSQKAERQKS